MKEKLIELLGLPADADDQKVIDAVVALQRQANAETDAKKSEAAITALMKESGYALSRTAAAQVLADRNTAAKTAKKETKK